jgi:hypothetical protein
MAAPFWGSVGPRSVNVAGESVSDGEKSGSGADGGDYVAARSGSVVAADGSVAPKRGIHGGESDRRLQAYGVSHEERSSSALRAPSPHCAGRRTTNQERPSSDLRAPRSAPRPSRAARRRSSAGEPVARKRAPSPRKGRRKSTVESRHSAERSPFPMRDRDSFAQRSRVSCAVVGNQPPPPNVNFTRCTPPSSLNGTRHGSTGNARPSSSAAITRCPACPLLSTSIRYSDARYR